MTPRRWISLTVGLAGAGFAVWLVVRDEAARSALGDVALGALAVVLVLQVVNVVADSHRYRMVLPERYRIVVGRWQWHRIFALGRLLNSVVPQGGMAYRAAHLKLGMGVPVSAFFGSVAVISWLGNGLVLALAGVVVVLAGRPLPGIVVVVTGLVVLVLIAAVPRLSRRDGLLQRLLPRRMAPLLESFAESFVELFGRNGRLPPVLAVTLVTQVAGAAAFVVVCVSLGIDDPLVVGSVLYAATTVMTFVSLTPASIGVTELAAGLAGGLLDIGAATGILVALVIRVTGIASVGLLAAVAGLLERPERTAGADPA